MARASERISGARARPDIPLCRLRRADEETLPLPGLMGHRTRAMTIYCDESGGLNAGAMTFAAVMLTPEVAAAIHARFRAVTGLKGELKGSSISLTERAYLPELFDRAGGCSEENTSELQSLMRIPYAAVCLKKKTINEILIS